jgi:hypothetical protein
MDLLHRWQSGRLACPVDGRLCDYASVEIDNRRARTIEFAAAIEQIL